MKIAIPTFKGLLCPHFGHCEEFTFVDVERETGKVLGTQSVPAPDHQPGLLPGWLREHGADIVIAGGCGVRAQQLFAEEGMQCIVGSPVASPLEIVNSYLDGSLDIGANICDH